MSLVGLLVFMKEKDVAEAAGARRLTKIKFIITVECSSPSK